MKILHLIDDLGIGGAQKLLSTFANEANKRDVQVTVVALSDRRPFSSVKTELENSKAQVVILKGRKVFTLSKLQEIVDLIQHENFSIIHTHLMYANIIGNLIAFIFHKPVVTTLHNTLAKPNKSTGRLLQKIENFILQKLPARIIAVGKIVAETHQPNLLRKLDIIPNATLPPRFIGDIERKKLRSHLPGDPDQPICIAIGRLHPQKGYFDLIEAFRLVNQTHPQATLLIVGDGVLQPDLTAEIQKMELENSIHLLGIRDDVPSLLAAADIYVNASIWEGLPVSHLEAMTAGLPLVVTAVGDVPNIMINGIGILLPAKQPAEMAKALASILDDQTLRISMGQKAKQHALNHYNPENWFQKHIDIYQQILGQSRK